MHRADGTGGSDDNYADTQGKRYTALRSQFLIRFAKAPEVYAHAPGRVNLIGEHIDYEGYAVLPMAIELDTLVAIRVNPTRDAITLRNVDENKFGDLTFPTDPDQEVDLRNHTWGNYVIAAYKGVFDHLRANDYSVPETRGLDIMVDGRVPTGSGLSSSAALVCSSALAIMAALGVPRLKKGEVAEFTAKAEQYVGVMSGGMDQAISVMGAMGEAQLIEFNPVRASPVLLPPSCFFIVANSLKVSEKAVAGVAHYNVRVVECRIASALLAKKLGATNEEIKGGYKTLKEVEPLIEAFYMEHREAQPDDDSSWCVAAVDEFLMKGYCTTPDVEKDLGLKLSDLFEGDSASSQVLRDVYSFNPHARATHVYTEKQRVYDFAQVCADSRVSHSKVASVLGSLMDASHKSCDEWYECSCPELNALVELLRKLGAVGARLTGAGWGGCAVALVKSETAAHSILKDLHAQFYQSHEVVDKIRKEEGETAAENFIQDMAFVSVPAQGACVVKTGFNGDVTNNK
jgi:N-acetylgalactosamine kinase